MGGNQALQIGLMEQKVGAERARVFRAEGQGQGLGLQLHWGMSPC